jgi:CBS domain-containing protein
MKSVKEILCEQMHRQIYSVSPNQSVLSAAQYMESKNIGAVPVVDHEKVVGIVSERDMLKKVLREGIDPRDTTVEKIMTRSFLVTFPDETIEDCLIKMRKAHCRHLPVLEEGVLLGTISLRDILGITEAELLDDYLWNVRTRRRYSRVAIS